MDKNLSPTSSLPSDNICSRLNVTNPVSIIFRPSAELQPILQNNKPLPKTIIGLLARSKVLYKSAWAASIMVFQVNQTFAVKIAHEGHTTLTKYQSLAYLREQLPNFPTPQPHSLIRFRHFCLLFTTFIEGVDLETAWPQLRNGDKQFISTQINTLLTKLRLLPFADNTPVGGVGGQGCRDVRRTILLNTKTITNDTDFKDWIFSRSRTASPLYTQFLRSLIPTSQVKCVFTHGDIRPANIMVRKEDDGSWQVAAIIDWEASGFYPEYWECVKATNDLTLRDNFDWYEYLPELASPRRYPVEWLVDRLWDRNMNNS